MGHASDAARLGTICHGTIETLIASGFASNGEWAGQLDAAWQASLNQDRLEYPGLEAPRRWTLAFARLSKVMAELEQLLSSVARNADVVTEVDLSSQDGLLAGRADLIVRADEGSMIIDYKTGAAVDRETGELRESYARQLKLYSYLEHEVTGTWPTTSVLLPFVGTALRLPILPADCEAVATSARETLASYNKQVPHPPPAYPAPGACIWCDAAAACPRFWAACDADWAGEGIRAGRGTVEEAAATPLGGLTVRFDSIQGSIRGTTTVRGIDPNLQTRLTQGSTVGFIGLIAERGSQQAFVAGQNLRLQVESKGSVSS